MVLVLLYYYVHICDGEGGDGYNTMTTIDRATMRWMIVVIIDIMT